MFMGLYSAPADIGNVSPSTLLNMVGIGFDSGQTTLRLFRNDGSGSATAVDLSAGFPITGSQILYERILSAAPDGSDIRYRIERLNSGDVAEGGRALHPRRPARPIPPHGGESAFSPVGSHLHSLRQLRTRSLHQRCRGPG